MAVIEKDLGAVSAYAIAVEYGYKGTEEEFGVNLAESANHADLAAEAKRGAETAADHVVGYAQAADNSAKDAQTAAADAAASQTAAQQSEAAAENAKTAAETARDTAELAKAAAEDCKASAESSAAAAQEAAEEAKQAAMPPIQDDAILDSKVWSGKGIIDHLCSPFEERNSVVVCRPVEGYPLGVQCRIEPVQAGKGAPSRQNIRPIAGYTSAVLTRGGKNLIPNYLNRDGVTNGGSTFSIQTDGAVTVSAPVANPQNVDFRLAGSWKNEVPIFHYKAGQIFTLSFPTGSSKYTFRLASRANGSWNDVVVCRGDPGVFVWKPSEDGYITDILCTADAGFQGDGIGYPQLELGDTASGYQLPAEDAVTVSFGETVYGGTVDFENGTLTVDRILRAFDGTESAWRQDVPTENGAYRVGRDDLADAAGNPVDEIGHILCSHYPAVSGDDTWGETTGVCLYSASDAQNGLWFFDPNIQTAEEWKTFLAGQYAAGKPVQICYKLKNPRTIQLDMTQMPALDGANYLYCNAGEITVTGRTDPFYEREQIRYELERLKAAAAQTTSLNGEETA